MLSETEKIEAAITPNELPVRHIRPGSDGIVHGLRELWQFRELVFFFALRNISVRYKQTVLGFGWVIVQPLVYSGLFGIVFGRFAQLPSQDKPYALYSLCGLIPWMAFSSAFMGSSLSVVGEQSILKKVYFPKLASVFSTLGVVFMDAFVQCILLLVMLGIYGQPFNASLFLCVPLVFLAGLTGVAAGIWLSAVNVRYRDVQFVLPFLIQMWMYASPVAYSSSIVPERWMTLYSVNPVAPLIDCFRWATLGVEGLPPQNIGYTLVFIVLSLGLGISYFKHMEIHFADEV